MTFNENDLLTKLSANLRQEAILCINETIIRNNAFFRGMDASFIAGVIMKLKKFHYMPEEACAFVLLFNVKLEGV